MKLQEALRHAEAQLRLGPHAERARLDAESLMLHVIGRNRTWLLTHGDEEFGGCTAARYGAMLQRRQRGEPIQYITGECEFYGLPFRVTPAVLIPRPETEHLVERAIELARDDQSARILDVGTGSGAIAVAIEHALRSKRVTAIDLSEEALEVARGNAARNDADVRFLQGDLLEPVAGETFELVVSNPPYVPQSDAETLSVEVREHEPHLALFADGDGLSVYRRLIPQAFGALEPGGHILLEIGYAQADAVRGLLEAYKFADVKFVEDLQGIPRVVEAMRGKD
jgi:release factor glutamine methyltransferase